MWQSEERIRGALENGLRLCGFEPDRYDADAILGRLLENGIRVITNDDVEAVMFNDRCDFECTVCHPIDDIEDLPTIDERGNPL